MLDALNRGEGPRGGVQDYVALMLQASPVGRTAGIGSSDLREFSDESAYVFEQLQIVLGLGFAPCLEGEGSDLSQVC
jgi:hypothetical protein